jgi:diacylglycerol kinase family enzyme
MSPPPTTAQTGPPGRVTSLALVANAGSRECDPRACAEHLRNFGAEVESFGIDEVEPAAAAGAERLVVAGGDGSIGLAAAAAGRAGIPLAVIPVGTAHDFAARMELPEELAAACRLAAQGTEVTRMELGWLEPVGGGGPRPFVNVASAGLPGRAARSAKAWKAPLGTLGYAAGALVAGLTAKPLPARLECDGTTVFDGSAWQVTAAASGAFGAGARVEEADPHDGALDLVVVEAGSRLALVALGYRLRRGGLTGHGDAGHTRCRDARLEVAPGTVFNVDGEIVPAGPVALRGERDAFGLVTA